MIPHSREYDHGLQLSYELPHRVHAAAIYPVPSPNGSTIVLYGYESGLRVLWRGGKPFKLRPHDSYNDAKLKPVGSANDAVMIIDSDDEEPSANNAQPDDHEDDAEFESEDDEDLPDSPSESVIQQLDITLDTEVLRLAVPNVRRNLDKRFQNSTPALFRKTIVLAVACADGTFRVITLPLTPPSPARKSAHSQRNVTSTLKHGVKGWFGEEMLVLDPQVEQQSMPNAVAVTWTSLGTAREDDEYDTPEDDGPADDSQRRRGSTSLSRSISRNRPTSREWALLIATHSPHLSGLLHVYKLPLLSEADQASISKDSLKPVQTLYLSHPATSIAFNPCQYPSRRHSHLLMADTSGAVRIYDCLPPPKSRSRSSRHTPDGEQRGSWLITLLPPFAPSPHTNPVSAITIQRKRVVDAQWILTGRGVIVLLGDGEWGIWDIEGIGPAAQKGHPRGESAHGGISGSGITKFALRGYVGINPASTAVSATSSGTLRPRGSGQAVLAPMTPHTRKVREALLFSGPAHSAGLSRGGISVTAETSPGRLDDSLILWYNDNVYSIPSLMAMWQRSVGGSVGGGSLHGPALKRLDHLDLYGEFINRVQRMPSAGQTPAQESILVTAEHRLIVLDRLARNQTTGKQPFSREQAPPEHTTRLTTRLDQKLLAKGQLDLGGVDRLLDSMQGHQDGFGVPKTRRVGFAS